MKILLKLFFIICLVNVASAQLTPPNFWIVSDTLHKPRRNFVAITESSLAALTLVGLDRIWYADFQRSSFHFINDNDEWLQLDKAGHVLTSYYVGNIGAKVLNWSGVSKKNQLIYGATLGFSFLTAVEVMDGFSAEWGASFGDIAANGLGTGLYVGQELLWEEQRIKLKYSFHRTRFAEIRPNKLGDGFLEEVLKDYNGQTYWLSANVHSFFKQSKIPKWFNVAFGYGAEGLIAGTKETQLQIVPNQQRYRQFYLSIDIDLTKIETNSKFLNSVFSVINFIKIPAPTLEINSLGKMKFHAIYF
ncbi:hypothetical protein IMCC3317_47630 [Kordia antarctica]|uniref:DUF2279 domain-containing protein n=1 Tax=Kordia antarctica TaxID=1218801 RepID=A0A7L4ZRL1_9FLAO|nr:DUF2279 domain-containing protein [Kordia antarctica]QHI39353.1 hypothetical protein IMCC3317_47630 [Kordia antarctica]